MMQVQQAYPLPSAGTRLTNLPLGTRKGAPAQVQHLVKRKKTEAEWQVSVQKLAYTF